MMCTASGSGRLIAALSICSALCACRSGGAGGPRETLGQYIQAIEKNQPAVAYALLDEDHRRHLSLAAFTARWKTFQPELREQATRLRASLARVVPGRARVTLPQGPRVALVYEGGRWKIEQGIALDPQTPTPVDALRAFIRAVEERSYEGVMRLMARSVRENIEKDIAERLAKLKKALGAEIEVSGSKARIQYDPRFKIDLTIEDGQWKIQDLD